MTSFIADTTAFVAHQPETVFALLATCRTLMNSSIVPVMLSNDELWDLLCTKPFRSFRDEKYLKLFHNFSDTMEFTEKLRLHSNRWDHPAFFEEILLNLIKTKRYFARTVQHITIRDVQLIPKIAGKLSNIRFISFEKMPNEEVLDDTKVQLLCDHFTRLKTLDLSGQYRITSAGCRSISNLKMLTEIDFSYSGITDIPFLHSCKNLRKLNLHGCLYLTETAFGMDEDNNDDTACPLLPSLLEINIEGVSYAATDGCIELLQRNAPNLLSLTCESVQSEELYSTISSITTLQSLNMLDCSNLTEECAEEMMLKLINLETLSIRCGYLLNERCMRLISETSAPIRVLELHCCRIQDHDAGFHHLTSMRSLETLKLDDCSGERSFIGDIMAKENNNNKNHSLKNLHIMECSDLTDAGLMSMTKGLSLKSLVLRNCDRLTNECLQSAFKENSNMVQSLEVLDLWKSTKITSLKFLKNYHLVSLNTLILNDTGIEDEDIVDLVSSSSKLNYKKNLKALDLSGCAHLTDRALTDGVSNLKNLEYIGLGTLGFSEREVFSMQAILSSLVQAKYLKRIYVNIHRRQHITQDNAFYYKKIGHLIKIIPGP